MTTELAVRVCSPPGRSTSDWVEVMPQGAGTVITGVSSSLTSTRLRSADGDTDGAALALGLALGEALADADDGDAEGVALSGSEQADSAIRDAVAVARMARRSVRAVCVTPGMLTQAPKVATSPPGQAALRAPRG